MKKIISLLQKRYIKIIFLAVSGILTGLTVGFPSLGVLEWLSIIPMALVLFSLCESSQHRLRSIYAYGLFFFIGIFVAGGIAAFIKKKRNIDGFDLLCSVVFTLIFAIVGAKLLFIIVSWDYVVQIFSTEGVSFADKMGAVLKGGFVFYGGFIG